MTYVRKDLEASQKLLKDEEHPTMHGHPTHEHGPLDVINIYNAALDRKEQMKHPTINGIPSSREGLICGDFNLHHGHWDPNTPEMTGADSWWIC